MKGKVVMGNVLEGETDLGKEVWKKILYVILERSKENIEARRRRREEKASRMLRITKET